MATETKPPMAESDESNSQQLDLAKAQGRSFDRAVEEMTKHEAHGRETRAGDYRVGIAVENAEGMYHMRDGRLEWANPSDENAHIEVVVRDAADGRFIPQLGVRVTVLSKDGQEVGTHEQPFLWHPWLYHYGRNRTLPRDGEYTIRVHVDAPAFGRHDRTNGCRFASPVDVEFAGVHIETGQKRS